MPLVYRSVSRWVALLSLVAAFLAGCVQSPPFAPLPEAARRASPLPEGWHHGVFMEIFVRAYQDSDGDGIGDLRGLISRLDYLQDLGVRGIWLMPITRNADGDHGYATTDFRDIAPEYGTLADFDELLKQAHARGIGVIIDYVINHSAAEHPYFVAARSDPRSPWRDWYVFSDRRPTGWWIWDKDPWYAVELSPWRVSDARALPPPPPQARDFYFGTFGPHMPDFNFRNPVVQRYHAESLRFWLDRGLDGFRLDAVPHLVENDAVAWNDQPESRRLTGQMQALVKSYPRRWVVCEATAEPAVYAAPDICGAGFAFGYVHHYLEAARGKPDSVRRVAEFYRTAPHTLATFLSNHDIFAGRRVFDQFEGDGARYRLAAASYLLQPGTPFVYYGEEIGQPGLSGLPGDQPLRGPMRWTAEPERGGFTTGRPFRPLPPHGERHNAASQQADPGSLHAFYKTLIGLRNRHPALARGSYEAAEAQGLVATWQRRFGADHVLVAINYGETVAALQVPDLVAGMRLEPLHGHPTPATGAEVPASGRLVLEMPPQSLRVFTVRSLLPTR